ncbi:MAG: fibronectin type III domain-containing protein [Bacteroidales bacterium]|nr:fibronectin type III domain-containing protein [Bacteroidales bacterium]
MMKMYRYIVLATLTLSFLSGISQVDIPDAPEFKSASVVPESTPSSVRLSWIPSDSLDVAGYIIYEVVSSVTETVDTVWGRLTDVYLYEDSQSGLTSEIFRIAAFDDLFYKSQITSPHTTVFLSFDYDKCTNKTDLVWTPYSGWSAVNKYNIYRRTSTSTYQIVASVSGSVNQFTDDELEMNKTYYYYVEAISPQGYTATSNSISFASESYLLPSYMYAEYATVSGDNINLKFVVDNTAEVSEYRVQRSTTSDGGYVNIKSIVNSGQTEILVTDTDSDPDANVYYYRLASINPCGIVNLYSNYASNILLSATVSESLNHSLEWTQYEQWQNGVYNYRVYRYFGDVEAEIDVNPTGDLDYMYDIAWYVDYCHDRGIHTTNKFCYFVEAVENPGHTITTNTGRSRSNVACVYHEPLCWMPNAFNISSYEQQNREFKPVLSFAQDSPYEFVVYDKWGNPIFRTEETFEGWDGILNHQDIAPSQYYTYFVRYYDHKNKEHIKTGTFFLLVE